MKKPTIRDVAKHAGVGIGTVSRVLNDSTQVSQETRQRVLATIELLGFRPNQAARQLSGGKTMTVGVLSPFFTQPSFIERLNGIQAALDGTGYDLVLYSIRTPEQLERQLEDITSRNRLDGLVLITLGKYEAALQDYDPTLPTVLITEIPTRYYPNVSVDNVAGSKLATNYLIENDHMLIGYIADQLDNVFGTNATRQRYEGFIHALADADLPHIEEWCKFGQHSQQSAFELAYEMLRQDDRPTAIVASSDTIAFGVLEAAHVLRLRVPQDVAIIGFDDVPAAKLVQLTTIRQPLFEGGYIAIQRLMTWLAQGGLDEQDFQTTLPLELVQRRTV